MDSRSLTRTRAVLGALLLALGLVAWRPAPASAGLRGAWTLASAPGMGRSGHTATALPDGSVLVAGGSGANGYLASAERFDPAAGTFAGAASLLVARVGHTATALADGRVLIVGGRGAGEAPLASAEVYDPAAGTFAPAGSLAVARYGHTATLLPNGRVLIAGGITQAGGWVHLTTAELYDATTGTFTPVGDTMSFPHAYHTATLLPDGRVFLAGGGDSSASAELYDPAAGTFSETNLALDRTGHTATLLADGRILLVGGYGSTSGSSPLAYVYDPVGGSFTYAGSMAEGRYYHTATVLPDGRVLLAGGTGYDYATGKYTNAAGAELYDPATNAIAPTGFMTYGHCSHTATPLADGRVLVVGGEYGGATSAELYGFEGGGFVAASPAALNRGEHTSTLLADGTVFLAGGRGFDPATNSPVEIGPAEVYDPSQRAFALVGSLLEPRAGHTATVLLDGRVLLAGGLRWDPSTARYQDLASAELYDPATRTFLPVPGSLAVGRAYHTATLLSDGRVLLTGGSRVEPGVGPTAVGLAEVYEPWSGTFAPAGDLVYPRSRHTATLLPDGRVLVAGGSSGFDPAARGPLTVAPAELYDPALGAFVPTGALAQGREAPTATLLPDGSVLVTGGSALDASGEGTAILASAELYDPATGTFASAADLTMARGRHTATLLTDGRVLLAGGGSSNAAELFDPASGRFVRTASSANPLGDRTAALLQSGQVLFAGSSSAPAELYYPSLNAPYLARVSPAAAVPGAQVLLTGFNFGSDTEGGTVAFDGVEASPSFSWTDGQIWVTVPFGAASGPLVVTAGGRASDAVAFTVLAPPDPTIQASAGLGGSITPAGAVTVRYGGGQVFTISPAPGYRVTGVWVDNVDQGAITSYSFADVRADHAIVAAFALDTRPITATAGTNGSISPAGEVAVPVGGSQTFVFSPAPGYRVQNVVADGYPLGALSSYTFTNVTAAHSIHVTFTTYAAVTILTPNGGEVLVGGVPYKLTWGAPPAAVKFTLSYSPDGKKYTTITNAATGTSFVWPVPATLRSGTAYRIKVVGLDARGRSVGSDTSDAAFSVVAR